MNKAFEWIKQHPTTSIAVGVGFLLVIYLASRSSSSTGTSSDVAAVENSQLQQAQLANQNAVVQAQANAQNTQTELSAQVANNQTAAELAAQVAQYQAAENTASLAAGVQNNTTAAQENVADTTVNAELAAQQSQVAAESAGLNTEFSYLTDVANNNYGLSQTAENILATTSRNNSQLATVTGGLEAITGSQGPATAEALAGSNISVGGSQSQAAIVSAVSNGIANAFSGLFA